MKKIEGRKNSLKWKKLEKGNIKIKCGKYKCICKINNIRKYKNVREYLIKEGLENRLLGIKILNKVIKIYSNYNKDLSEEKFNNY